MVKVLVTGASGQVGKEILKLAPADLEVVGYSSSELDVTNTERVEQIINEQSPDLVINAAAFTAVDKAESEIEHAYAVNEFGVKNLAGACQLHSIPLFHISTDYVFDGDNQTSYKESDPVGPTGVYGASKLAGEQLLRDASVKHITLRTSWVFGAEGHNFVKTMIRLANERDQLAVVSDQYGCPTSARSIASVLWYFAQKFFVSGDLPWGTYHFCNSPMTTWYDFAEEIIAQACSHNLIAQKPLVKRISTFEYPTPAKRPSNSALDCTLIESTLGITVPEWKVELSRVLTALTSEL